MTRRMCSRRPLSTRAFWITTKLFFEILKPQTVQVVYLMIHYRINTQHKAHILTIKSSVLLQSRRSKQKGTLAMNRYQATTWTCGHIQQREGTASSNHVCLECKTRRANFYQLERGNQRADYYRPKYERRRVERNGDSIYKNGRMKRVQKYYRGRRREDDWRKGRRIIIRQTQRNRSQGSEVRVEREKLLREQDRYEEERERKLDEEYCDCSRCSVERRVRLGNMIYKWLARIEEVDTVIEWASAQRLN